MKAGRISAERAVALPPIPGWLRAGWLRLSGDNAVSVNNIDAGIRTLAVVTVLVLSILGFGKSSSFGIGLTIDPVLIATGLVVYNMVIVLAVGVPWRRSPGFALFVVDWAVVSAALTLTGGFFSPFLVLYYALIIGAALRVGLYRSLLLVGGCAFVFILLSSATPAVDDAIHLPLLVVSITALLMVAVTAVAMKSAVEKEERKVETEERTGAQLRLLNNLTRVVLSGSPDLQRVMRTMAAVSSQALGADRGLAVLFGAQPTSPAGNGGQVAGRGDLIVSDGDPSPLALSGCQAAIAKQAVRTHAPVLVDDVDIDASFGPGGYPGLESDTGPARTVACVPFLLMGGVIGVLFVARSTPEPFSETEVDLLTAIGQQMAVAVRLARLYETEREKASLSQQRERMERDFLSMVSHELRTPLTSIKTCASTLARLDDLGDADGKGKAALEMRLLNNIDRSTDRLITLVNELLEMSRLHAGRVSLHLQQLNMGEIVLDVVSQVRPLLDSRGQQLELDLPARDSHRWELLGVHVDRRRMEQVLLNFLSNANRYAPAGSCITLGATPRNGQVKVFVRDEGPGIPPGEQDRIFEKFYQASVQPAGEDVKRDGAGLGLAIARSLVVLHGGNIGVQSRPGRGSTFYFTIPSSDTPLAASQSRRSTFLSSNGAQMEEKFEDLDR